MEALKVPYNFKTLIFYHPSVKTDFLGEILNRGFNKSYKNSIGTDILTTDYTLNKEIIKFCFWDIATIDRFSFFRNSFYRGSSAAIFLFDYKISSTIFPLIPELIGEIYNTIGPIPIILVGLNANHSKNNEYVKEIIDEDYIFYFDFKNKLNFYEKILSFIADISIKLIHNSSDVVTINIQKHIQKYLDMKQECLNNFFEIVEEWGLKINNNFVKILNNYGLFSIDLINGNVLFESIMCENCPKFYKCQKERVTPKKKLCIVADSYGWSNIFIGGDKLLILSKILAILNGQLPNHVLDQMKEVLKCLDTPPASESRRFGDYMEFNNFNQSYLVYEDLSPQEIENRIKQLRASLWEGRIPPSTYYRMVECLNHRSKN